MNIPKVDSWELAAKIGGVLALAGSLLRWILTPVFVQATRKALAPELNEISEAATKFAVGDARFTAIERDIAAIESEVEQLRERVDELSDRRP